MTGDAATVQGSLASRCDRGWLRTGAALRSVVVTIDSEQRGRLMRHTPHRPSGDAVAVRRKRCWSQRRSPAVPCSASRAAATAAAAQPHVTIVDRTLVIDGTDAADSIAVRLSANNSRRVEVDIDDDAATAKRDVPAIDVRPDRRAPRRW